MAQWCQGHSGGRWVHSELSEKTTLQLTESQNELNGLRTNSWFWLPSNSQAGGLSDGTVRERGGGRTLITQRPLVAASAAVRKEKLNFIQSCLQKATQPGNPNVEFWRAASRCKWHCPCFFQGDIRNTNTLAVAQYCAHTNTQSLAALSFTHTHRWWTINDRWLSGMSHILLNKKSKGIHSSQCQCSLQLYLWSLSAGCVCPPACCLQYKTARLYYVNVHTC